MQNKSHTQVWFPVVNAFEESHTNLISSRKCQFSFKHLVGWFANGNDESTVRFRLFWFVVVNVYDESHISLACSRKCLLRFAHLFGYISNINDQLYVFVCLVCSCKCHL